MWPFRKPNPVRKALLDKHRQCETQEGRNIVDEALALQSQHPSLSAGELIRLAYWGASGEPV